MFDLFSDNARRNPYPIYKQIRETSPLIQEPRTGLWMVFDFEAVKRVISDHEVFSSKAGPDWMIFVDPPRHTKLRALVSKAFTPRSIVNLEPQIAAFSKELLDKVIGRGEMDLAEDFAIPLPMKVIAEMLGIPASDQEHFIRWNDSILRMSYTVASTEGASQAASDFITTTQEMGQYLAGLLEARRHKPTDDLLTRLMHSEVDGQRLTEREILGFFQILLLAGTETTTNLIDNAILCLIEHPLAMKQLRANPGLLPSAIEEVLRYRSPFQWMFRITKSETTIHGQTIPARKMVVAVMGSANHDSKQFPNPETFDITRDPNPHIAFGHGTHFCLGSPLARLEGRIALSQLLARANHIELASSDPWQPRKGLHIHGPTRLPIRFKPASAHRA